MINFSFDALNRATLKDLPGSEPDVSYTHDLLGRMTGASQSGHALSFTFDALGRNLTQVGPQGTVTSVYDLSGRRTQLSYPGSGLYVDHDYLLTGELLKIRENGAGSGIGVLATFGYDDLGRRTSLTRGNGTVTSYGYDAASRLSQLTQDVASAHDLTLGFGYNPAGQITSNTRSNDAFAFTGHSSGTTGSTANGLNQLTNIAGAAVTHDARGNMTSDGTKSYGYSSENMLTSGAGASLGYDPLLRLYQVTDTATGRFGYDGADLIAEYDGSNTLQRRYVHGPGSDEPLVWYEGSGTADRRFLHADERGSIVAVSDNNGNVSGVNKYDEYGNPQGPSSTGTLLGRFGYTGQAWLPEIGLYNYKARIYDPKLGRFLQTDPIGYDDGMNLYAYVGNDPVNLTDPLGLEGEALCARSNSQGECEEIVVTGTRPKSENSLGPATGNGGGGCDGIAMGGRCVDRETLLIGGITIGGIVFDVLTVPSGEGVAVAAAAPKIAKTVLKPSRVTVKYKNPLQTKKPPRPQPPKTKAETVDRRDRLMREHDFAKGINESMRKRGVLETIADYLAERFGL